METTRINVTHAFGNNNTPTRKCIGYIGRIKYTAEHKKAYKKIEKELLGKNTIRSYTHDLNKIVLYALGLPTNVVHFLHRILSPHHVKRGKIKDPVSAVIDWESARYSKKEMQLSAFEFYKEKYPNGIPKIEENIKKLGLWKED